MARFSLQILTFAFRLKDQSKDKEKELQVLDMKIDAMAERIKDIDQKEKEFKDQLYEEKKKNHFLKKKLQMNEQEKLDLEQQLETGIKPTRAGRKGKGVFGNIDIESHQKMLEEKRRREREEMRRQLFVGIDFLGGSQLKVSKNSSTRCWDLTKKRFYQFFDVITPHRDDIKSISSKYDKAIEAYFQFFRFVVSFAIVISVVFFGILALHSMKFFTDNKILKTPDLCNSIPCYFYYSRFSNDYDWIYALSYLVFAVIGLIISVIQWSNFDLKSVRSKIYTNEDIFFSKMFFNAWDWKAKTFDDAEDTTSLIRNEITTAVAEDLIKEKIKHRTKEEKFDLIVRRTIFISLNIFIICCGVAAIFLVNWYNNSLQYGPSLASSLIPSFIVAFVNGAIPAATKKITACEKYDFASTLLKQQIWRMFAIRILNLTIYMLLNRELAFNDGYFKSTPVIDFKSSDYDCREDQAATNLARLMFTEYFVKFLSAFGWMGLNFCKGGCGAKKGWRAEFPVSEEVVWLLYFQTVVWTALLWNPFIVIIYPLMLYVMFKFVYFKVSYLQKKPLKSTNAQEMGSFIMNFLNISFLLIFIWIGYMLSDNLSHSTYNSGSDQCGPFKDNKSWRYTFGDTADSVYDSYYPVLWLILVIVI